MNSEEIWCVTVSTGLNWLRLEAFEASITVHKSKRFNVPKDAKAFVFGLWFVE
jgi:hypothetical protein